jgi:hypothetical protein
LLVASTIQDFEQMSRTTQELAQTTRRTAFAVWNYAVRAQELNIRFTQHLTQAWIDGLRQQAELSEEVHKLFEAAENQADAFQRFFGQWGFPVAGTTLDPFSLWREGMRLPGRTTQAATRNGG